MNPVTNKIYVANLGNGNVPNSTVTVIDEQQVQSIPLTTAITPFPSNVTGTAPTFDFTATSSYAPTVLPVDALFYQLDTWQGPWSIANSAGTPGAFATASLTLPLGTHILFAYATDGQEATSIMGALGSSPITGSISAYPFTVQSADFSLSANPTSATVSAGSTANYSISLTPSGGFNQSVSLSCTGAPSLAACTVSASSVTLDGTNAKTVAIQVTTTASQPALHSPFYFPPPAINTNQLQLCFLWLLGFALLAILVPALRRRLRLAFAIMVLICLAAACGGGSGSHGGPGTPPGTYTLTVTAASAIPASLSHDAAITLTVK